MDFLDEKDGADEIDKTDECYHATHSAIDIRGCHGKEDPSGYNLKKLGK